MNTSKLSETESQERAMQWLDSLTREDWQARIDAANEAFGIKESLAVRSHVNGKRSISVKPPKKSLPKVA